MTTRLTTEPGRTNTPKGRQMTTPTVTWQQIATHECGETITPPIAYAVAVMRQYYPEELTAEHLTEMRLGAAEAQEELDVIGAASELLKSIEATIGQQLYQGLAACLGRQRELAAARRAVCLRASYHLQSL